MNIAICDDDLLYMNQVKEMIENGEGNIMKMFLFTFLIMGML